MPGDAPPLQVAAPGLVGIGDRLPRWYRVAQALRSAVLTRDPEEGDRLPTEAELARHHGVSVTTLRRALAVLEHEGLISRHRRHGTFINRDVPRSRRLEVAGSLDTVVAQQAATEVRVLGLGPVATPRSVAERFPGQRRVLAVQRLRSEDGTPVSYAENYLDERHAATIAEEDLRGGSMTQLLRDRGVAIARVEETAEAHLATPGIARLLEVDQLSPILFCTGVTRAPDGEVVDLAHLYYRGDRFRLSLSIDVR